MKKWINTLLITISPVLAYNNLHAEEVGYTCIASATKDVCIKINKEEVSTPIEAFSKGYRDAMISHTGKALYDGVIGSAKDFASSTTQALLLHTLGRVAKAHGASSQVLNLLGVAEDEEPDLTNEQVVAEINRLMGEQTADLVKELDNLRFSMAEDVENLLSRNCSIQWQENYDAVFENINRWQGYSPSIQMRTENLISMENAKQDLVKIRSQYKSIEDGFCLWEQHVEFYSYLMALIALENMLRTEYHAIVSDDNEELKDNLIFDLSVTRDALSLIFDELEVGRTSDHLDKDLDPLPTDDKANAWWDDIVLDFSNFEHISGIAQVGDGTATGSQEVNTKTREKGDLALCSRVDITNPSNLGNSNSYIFDLLDRNNPIDFRSSGDYLTTKDVWRCPMFNYHVEGIEYIISQYIARGFDGTTIHESTIIVAESFIGKALTHNFTPSGDYISEVHNKSGTLNNRRIDETRDFTEKVYREHMDLLYTQRLQMSYLPYVEFLDSLWRNTSSVRNSNKLDREYSRTSGLLSLDLDGLSILEEIELGTDPRNHDSDSDGFDDGWESLYKLDPLSYSDPNLDRDNDGYSEIEEYQNKTNPISYDGLGCYTGDSQLPYHVWKLEYGYNAPMPVITVGPYNYIQNGDTRELEFRLMNGNNTVHSFRSNLQCNDREITLAPIITYSSCPTDSSGFPYKLWQLKYGRNSPLPANIIGPYTELTHGASRVFEVQLRNGGSLVDVRYIKAKCNDGEILVVN